MSRSDVVSDGTDFASAAWPAAEAGVNVEVMNPERPNSELLACLKDPLNSSCLKPTPDSAVQEEGGKFELCEQKELEAAGSSWA